MVRYLSSREGRHPFWKEDEGKTMAAVSYHGHSATKAFNKYKLCHSKKSSQKSAHNQQGAQVTTFVLYS